MTQITTHFFFKTENLTQWLALLLPARAVRFEHKLGDRLSLLPLLFISVHIHSFVVYFFVLFSSNYMREI
jgi:hypothetical protein